MSARVRKKMDKQVKKDLRSAALEVSSIPTLDNSSIDTLLSRLPSAKKKKEMATLKSFEKNFNLKKKQSVAKQSKRTNTGLIDTESSPQHVHIEGARWKKTIGKQVKTSSKIFNKASLKKK